MHDFVAAWTTGDFARCNKEVSRALSEPKNSADASENVAEERKRKREDRARRVAADRERIMEPRGEEGEEVADRNETKA